MKIKLPKKYAKMIASIDKEQDGYFINTQTGYSIPENGTHTYSVDTLKDVKESLWLIKPCDCQQCQHEKENPKQWDIFNDAIYVGDIETIKR